MRGMLQAAAVAVALVAGGSVVVASEAESSIGKKIDGASLTDVHGKSHELTELAGGKPLVIGFIGTECPLAKVYASRLAALADEYAAKGVKFIAVDANLQDSLSEIAGFARAHEIKFPVLKDINNRLADAVGATRTPEVFLLDAERVVRYGGRIDDQYGFKTGAGYAKPRLERRDLAAAIDELLDGKAVSLPLTKADGCLIGRVKREPKGDVTFSNQISRILQKRCQECHRAGEVAPFAMDSYDDIVGWADMIREVVSEGRMPPWYASPQHKFANDPRLSDEEKQLIAAWVENGCPEGDRSQLPEPRKYAQGWQMGDPDQIVYMNEEGFDVPSEGTVEYKYFSVDPGWKEDKWVQATESRPGNTAVVHHIIVFIQQPGGGDGGQMTGLGGYAPGNAVDKHPEGTAIRVPAGSKLLFQMHYTPNGTAMKDRSMIGIKFADPKTVKQRIHGDAVGNLSFKIPPGDSNFEVRAHHKFRREMLLLNMTPHMHLRGKDFRFELEYPDGKMVTLLDVPQWDFNWQLRYEPVEPVLVPKGATLRCTAHFDNSAENPANPDPTATVKFGDQTWEEMMFGFYASIDPHEDLTAKVAAEASKSDKPAKNVAERAAGDGGSGR